MFLRLKSHLMIADKTIELIEYFVGIDFNKSFVKIGAVLPDIQPIRRIQNHSPIIVAEHYNIEFLRIVNKEKMINRISLILGILSHYIADAFTLSHNKYVINLANHIKYEYLLDDLKNDVPLNFKHLVNDVEKHITMFENNFNDVSNYIKAMNNNYLNYIKGLNWEQNVAFDIKQSIIHASTLLINFIFELQKVPVLAVCTA